MAHSGRPSSEVDNDWHALFQSAFEFNSRSCTVTSQELPLSDTYIDSSIFTQSMSVTDFSDVDEVQSTPDPFRPRSADPGTTYTLPRLQESSNASRTLPTLSTSAAMPEHRPLKRSLDPDENERGKSSSFGSSSFFAH